MKLECKACGGATELGSGWPGDVVKCGHCGADIHLPRVDTVAIGASTSLTPSGEYRPETLADDEVLPAGTMLGQYRVESFVGRGGMGSVYRATHTMLHRTVAVKVLPPKFARDAEFVQRFRREALALANLAHPNIVAVHDMGQQGEIYFLVMEFVEGANLRDLLVARKIPPEEALKIVPQLCDALEYAHAQGVIHRDIKPENIMLDRNGQAKIADFGLAKMVKGEKIAPSLTQTNVVMGTIEYMAPEQRDNMKGVDHRADIYSMGVVLYEMLTGELPVGRFDLPSRKVTVDVRVDDVVLKALEREPDRRYQRASQMGTDVSQMRVTRPPVGDLPILDLVSGKAVGTAFGRTLHVRARGGELRIEGWAREEIGLRVDGTYRVHGEAQPATLQGVETESMTVFVPKGTELDVTPEDAELRVGGFSGRLTARPGDEGFVGTDLEGRLHIVGGDGDVTIAGLRGEEIDIRTTDGSITVNRLHLVRGQASFSAHDGDVSVHLAPECSLRYQLYSSGGGVSHPPGGSGDDKAAAGTIGTGSAALSIRTHDGAASLRTGSGSSFDFSTEALRDLWRGLTPPQRERIGRYAIICGALWLATPIFGTIVPALATTVFWGMAIALDVWKHYVRGGAPAMPGPRGPGGAAAAYAAPAAPPVPAGPPPRSVSALAVFAVVAGGLALLSAVGLYVLGEWLPELDADADVYWVSIAAFSLAALVTGVVASFFGLATWMHVRESRGLLYGRTAAVIAISFGALATLGTVRRGFPALEGAREAGLEVREVALAVEESVRTGRVERMWRYVGSGVDEGSFRSELARAAAHPEPTAPGTLRRFMISPSLDRAGVTIEFGDDLRRVARLQVERGGDGWRVVNAVEFLKELGGAK